jgi:hypothetical protein
MMRDDEPGMSFGEDIAEIEDTEPDVSQRGEALAAVALGEQWAKGGPALERASGRAIRPVPLAARGIRVDGSEFSPAMIAGRRAQPGGDQIAGTMGNCADVPVRAGDCSFCGEHVFDPVATDKIDVIIRAVRAGNTSQLVLVGQVYRAS